LSLLEERSDALYYYIIAFSEQIPCLACLCPPTI
jgi:hypothetical protein